MRLKSEVMMVIRGWTVAMFMFWGSREGDEIGTERWSGRLICSLRSCQRMTEEML
jgi:hypothetical protein